MKLLSVLNRVKRLCPCLLLLTLASLLHAQSIYRYQDLSNFSYTRQKDSIKKNWVCPSLYKDKNTQKKYKELWDGRTDFITAAISNDRYVLEPEMQAYIASILNEIMAANPQSISSAPLLFIDRSAAVNAYAVGKNILAVNLGLISFAQSREEIALVLAHELSHNILNHPDRSMQEKAEWLTSAEYEQSLKDVMNSKYERYSRLKKIFEGYDISSSKHHRYHESDADSLAIVLLKNSRIGFDARFFLRLDSSDMQYDLPLKKPVSDYFTAYGLSFDEAWTGKRGKGLSSRAYSFNENTHLDDSLKTHPDCEQRYEATKAATTKGLRLTPVPASVKEKADKMIIWSLFDRMNLTAALYRVFQQKDKGLTDAWYDFMVSNAITGLYHADKNLRRFNAVGIVPKELVGKSYYGLQTALEQLPKEKLQDYSTALQAQSFWQSLPVDAKGLRSFLASLVTAEGLSQPKKLAAGFMETYKGSMYCEFAGHFSN